MQWEGGGRWLCWRFPRSYLARCGAAHGLLGAGVSARGGGRVARGRGAEHLAGWRRVWVGVCVARINDVGADRFTECFVMFRLLYLSSFLNDAIVIIVVVVVCFVFGTVRIFDAFILIEIHTRLVGSVTKQSFL